MNRYAYILVFIIVWNLLTPGVWAEEEPHAGSQLLPREEYRHIQAEALRQKSEDQARSNLGYEDASVYQYPRGQAMDFLVLSNQIALLGALIQSMGNQMSTRPGEFPGFMPNPPPHWAGPGSTGTPPGVPGQTELTSVYGPEGPNAKSVRLLLEYRLMVAGNPRLTIGKIVEEEERVTAQIVTVKGSAIVEEYTIDKNTGIWTPVRDKAP